MQSYFILGTDTNCGKTYVTCQLVQYLKKQSKQVLAIKPVASGCVEKHGQRINDDILHLEKANGVSTLPISSWLLAEPLSPHLAAKRENISISAQKIVNFCTAPQFKDLDYLFIEGAGGLMVPLNAEETWIDFLKQSDIPVILVVGMRLGCLNHALLTLHALNNHGIKCVGWIANCLDEKMQALEENIETLILKFNRPLLATITSHGFLNKLEDIV
jgi:dethiobiotin synthetase